MVCNSKDRKYHEDPFRAVNFRIDEQGVMRCPNDKAFHLLYRRSVRGNQYGRKEELYECEDCSGCPYAEKLYWSSFLVTLCSEIMLYIETPLVSYSYSLNEVSHSCTS